MAKKEENPLEAYKSQEKKVRECQGKLNDAKAKLRELEPAMKVFVAEENAKQLEKYKEAAASAAEKTGIEMDVTPDLVAAAVAAYLEKHAPELERAAVGAAESEEEGL